MALIVCPSSQKQYSDTLNQCPHCKFTPTVFICPECSNLCSLSDPACFMYISSSQPHMHGVLATASREKRIAWPLDRDVTNATLSGILYPQRKDLSNRWTQRLCG